MELEALTSGYKVFNFRQCGMVGLKFDFKWFFGLNRGLNFKKSSLVSTKFFFFFFNVFFAIPILDKSLLR